MKKYINIVMLVIMTISLCSCQGFFRIGKGEEGKTEVILKPESEDIANVITISVYDFDTFNPLATSSVSIKDAMKFVYEPLFALDKNMNAVPVIAEGYTISDNGKTIDVKLREDVLWHDGSRLTSKDVAYTVENIINGTTTYQEDVSNLASCTIKDTYLVSIGLKRGVFASAALLTFPILKNGTPMNADASYKPIGTGPFAYNRTVGIDRYMLVASDCYYKGKAKIGGIYIDVVPDNRRYFTMFDSGNNDVCNSALLEGYEYGIKSNVNVNNYVSNRLIYIGINNKSSFLKDAYLRRAIDLFIDRTLIEEKVMYSKIKAVDTLINPESSFYNGDKSGLRTNSLQGAQCLQSALWQPQPMGYTKVVSGVTKSLRLELMVNKDNIQDMKIAQKVKENLVSNGIDIVLADVPEQTYNQRIADRDYDLFIGRRNMSFSQDISSFLVGEKNCFGYDNATIDVIEAEMAKSTDMDIIKELYAQIRNVLEEDVPIVPIAYEKSAMYMSTRIDNVGELGADGYYHDLQNWSIK